MPRDCLLVFLCVLVNLGCGDPAEKDRCLYQTDCEGEEICIENQHDNLFPDKDDVFSEGNERFTFGGLCMASSNQCEQGGGCGPSTACVVTNDYGAGYGCEKKMFDRPFGMSCFYNDRCTSGLCVDTESESCEGCGTHRLCSEPSSDCAQACDAGRVCATDPETNEVRCLLERPGTYPRSE